MLMLLPLLLAVIPTSVLTAADTADAKCVNALAHLTASPGPDQVDNKAAMLYFVGKLDTRHPGIDLRTAIREAEPATPRDLKTELARCNAELEAVAERLNGLHGVFG